MNNKIINSSVLRFKNILQNDIKRSNIRISDISIVYIKAILQLYNFNMNNILYFKLNKLENLNKAMITVEKNLSHDSFDHAVKLYKFFEKDRCCYLWRLFWEYKFKTEYFIVEDNFAESE